MSNHDEKQNSYNNVLHLRSCMVVWFLKFNPKKNTTKKTNEQKKWMKAHNELIPWVRILTSWPQMALDNELYFKSVLFYW
jgi:hypothetical protein